MIGQLKNYRRLYIGCKKSETNFWHLLVRNIYYKVVYKRDLCLHQNVSVKGVKNICQEGSLQVGIGSFGFVHKTDKTYLNIRGKLIVKSNYHIGRGCRFDIGDEGVMTIGKNGYISPNTTFIVAHSLTIGNDTIISWNCQFLDEDFHNIIYTDKKEAEHAIKIGNHVWIGCGVKIYKGTSIPDNCIVASDSIVKGVFTDENCLIGGNPAKILKRNVSWS